MDDLRRWAARINGKEAEGAFTQYLLGNRGFEESAMDAIESILSEDQDTLQDVIDGLNAVAATKKDDLDWDTIAARLESFRDVLSFRFHLKPTPPRKAPEAPKPAPPQEAAPKPPAKKAKAEPTKASESAVDLMDLLGG
jgi:hypothetical protein